jgi:hypothetical protein
MGCSVYWWFAGDFVSLFVLYANRVRQRNLGFEAARCLQRAVRNEGSARMPLCGGERLDSRRRRQLGRFCVEGSLPPRVSKALAWIWPDEAVFPAVWMSLARDRERVSEASEARSRFLGGNATRC